MTMKSIIKSALGDIDNEAEEKKKDDTTKNAFIICPVRQATEEVKTVLDQIVSLLEQNGIKVHYPSRDTNQDDPIGINICKQNGEAIKNADMVYVFWHPDSTGSLFDLGMVFMSNLILGKPQIHLLNKEDIKKIAKNGVKSFENVLLNSETDDGLRIEASGLIKLRTK